MGRAAVTWRSGISVFVPRVRLAKWVRIEAIYMGKLRTFAIINAMLHEPLTNDITGARVFPKFWQ